MEYHTPGVYIREVDSGAKPIASVSTSIPGFLGLFQHEPRVDAVAITGTDGTKTVRGKVIPQLVDTKGNVTAAKPEDAANALTTAFNFKKTAVKNLKALLEMNGHKPAFAPGEKGKIKITSGKTEVQVSETAVNAEGKVITADEAAIEDLLNTVDATMPLDKPKPKSAKDVLAVYGFEFSQRRGHRAPLRVLGRPVRGHEQVRVLPLAAELLLPVPRRHPHDRRARRARHREHRRCRGRGVRGPRRATTT